MKLTNKQIVTLCKILVDYKDTLIERADITKEKSLEEEIATCNALLNTLRFTYLNTIDFTDTQCKTLRRALWETMTRIEDDLEIQTNYYLDSIYGKAMTSEYRYLMKLYDTFKGGE